jgi:toxin-antitoxin system PIN domain toxin
MIAIDTNILVYAHRADLPFHPAAREVVTETAESRSPWALPWPCVHEFVAIVTHPTRFKTPTPLALAIDQVRAWLESPSVVPLAESAGYQEVLAHVLETSRVVGARVHDARVAALCIHHGVTELWTADRDFTRFPLTTRNPLVG